jgi:protein phosphatase
MHDLPATLRLDIAVRTDPGREREGNEDSAFVAASVGVVLPGGGTVEVPEPGWVVLGVCDGMGGAAAGEVASRAAADVISAHLLSAGEAGSDEDLGRRLIDAVEEASRRVREAARADPRLDGMGTTATVCALRGADLLCAQVGDSRAYLLRDGRLTQLTRDQTLATLLVEQGQLRREDVPDFELRHVILQAVGTAPRVEVDLRAVHLARGDVLLLCSDGLSEPVSDASIREVLVGAGSADEAAEALVARANAAGGPDNVTCIVARIHGEGLPAPASETPAVEKACPAPRPEEVLAAAEESQQSWLGQLATLVGVSAT